MTDRNSTVRTAARPGQPPNEEQAAIDYRQSHLQKGGEYDALLAADPLDAYMAQEERQILQQLIPQLFPAGIPRYLDFACGTGRVTEVVSAYAKQASGVDVSDSMVTKARLRCPNVSFHIIDVTKEHPPIGQFDLVTTFRFVGNAQDELRVTALTALHRLVADNGYLVLNSHRNPWSALGRLEMWEKHSPLDLTYPKLRRLLDRTGFRIVRAYGIGAWLLRHRFLRPDILASGPARTAERLSRSSLLVPVCPDAIIVAQKRS